MGIDAFVLHHWDAEDESFFIQEFVRSPDFDNPTRKKICEAIGLPRGLKHEDMAREIAVAAKDSPENKALVIQGLLSRPKPWLTFKKSSRHDLFQGHDPNELVAYGGKSEWYGPIEDPEDNGAHWYIKPIFIPHFEPAPEGTYQPLELVIRWLCFARFEGDVISLHWRGFTHVPNMDYVDRHNLQFPYWKHVPSFYGELGRLAHTGFREVELHNIVLHAMWEKYRGVEGYDWQDIKIRAESGGMAVNAKGASFEFEIEMRHGKGLKHLATQLRSAIQMDLAINQGIELPKPEAVDELILETLIREIGPLSYDFKLVDHTQEKKRVYRYLSYFGMKPEHSTQDCFPHIHIYKQGVFGSDIDQMKFLLSHWEDVGAEAATHDWANNSNPQGEGLSLFDWGEDSSEAE